MLNFSPLHADSYPSVFSLEKSFSEYFDDFPGTKDRLEGALYFANLFRTSGRNNDSYLSRRYLRASLSDYVAAEELARKEIASQDTFNILHSDWPLHHILKAIRNFHTHIGTSQVAEERMKLYQGEEAFNLNKWIVTGLTAEDLLKLDAFKGKKPKYDEEAARSMIAWLNDAQGTFGFPYLIYRGVVDMAGKLLVENR